jgi:hypothetical protein
VRLRLIVVAVLGVVGGCAPALEPIDRFDGELAAAHDKRRIVALVSPS